MASNVDIVNAGLTLIGESRIMSLDEESKPAREAKAIYDITRDALIAAHNWSFAKARANLPALSEPPTGSQFSVKYQLPVDCLRVLMVGETYVGVDLSSYRSAPSADFSIEGRAILSNSGAPLPITYLSNAIDSTLYSANFVESLATKIAAVLAEPITESNTKRMRAEEAHQKALSDAVRANAIELPPQALPDDEWLMSRL
jgi:hypothetical protein